MRLGVGLLSKGIGNRYNYSLLDPDEWTPKVHRMLNDRVPDPGATRIGFWATALRLQPESVTKSDISSAALNP